MNLGRSGFRVLAYLVQHAGHLVSKSELMDDVWGDTAVTENSLTRAIALLRRVLEDDSTSRDSLRQSVEDRCAGIFLSANQVVKTLATSAEP